MLDVFSVRADDVFTFLQEHHRLPNIHDSPAPWHYRGWLLPYVIQLHAVIPETGNRWSYHLRTLDAGHLLDEPIPPIHFRAPDKQIFGLLHDWSRLIGYDCGGWSDFRSLLDWLSWALALSDELPRLNEPTNEKLYRQVNLTPLLQTPWDYLGDHVAQSKSRGWNPTAFYPTPHPVVECMIRLTMHDLAADGTDARLKTVCDPCVGSGRMLLHASNLSLRLFGQDIDPVAISMCKINGALYAPWMAFQLPEHIVGPDRHTTGEFLFESQL